MILDLLRADADKALIQLEQLRENVWQASELDLIPVDRAMGISTALFELRQAVDKALEVERAGQPDGESPVGASRTPSARSALPRSLDSEGDGPPVPTEQFMCRCETMGGKTYMELCPVHGADTLVLRPREPSQ